MMRSNDYQSFKFLFVTTFSFLIFISIAFNYKFLTKFDLFLMIISIKKIKDNAVTLFVAMLSIFTFL